YILFVPKVHAIQTVVQRQPCSGVNRPLGSLHSFSTGRPHPAAPVFNGPAQTGAAPLSCQEPKKRAAWRGPSFGRKRPRSAATTDVT
ncbi:MAG: hypothetical protein RKL24_05990, partial [Defluviicoccus sp.]|nr:hypothetical protein [Defluviicoccus sp.]